MSNGFFFKKGNDTSATKSGEGKERSDDRSATPKEPKKVSRTRNKNGEEMRVVTESSTFDSEEEMLRSIPEGHSKYVRITVVAEEGGKVLFDDVVNGCFVAGVGDRLTEEERREHNGDSKLLAFSHAAVTGEQLEGMIRVVFELLKQTINSDNSHVRSLIVRMAAMKAGVLFDENGGAGAGTGGGAGMDMSGLLGMLLGMSGGSPDDEDDDNGLS
jgi:hypothetical protein